MTDKKSKIQELKLPESLSLSYQQQMDERAIREANDTREGQKGRLNALKRLKKSGASLLSLVLMALAVMALWALPVSSSSAKERDPQIPARATDSPTSQASSETAAPKLNTALPEDPSEPISVEFVANIVGAPENPQLSGAALAAETDRVSHNLRCPVCQGSSVGDSPSLSARNMKDEVRDLLAAGFSAEQVVRYFEYSYGEFVRLEPKAEGFNLLVWIGPLLLLVVGAVVTASAIHRFSAGGAALAGDGCSESGDSSEPGEADSGRGEENRPLYDLEGDEAETPAASSEPELASYLERVRALSSSDSGGGQEKDS